MEEDSEELGEAEDFLERDWLLTVLVDSVNKAGFSFGITLNISGGLVSGWVVSGNEYFHGIANVLEEAGGEVFAQVMRQVAVQRYPMFQPGSDEPEPQQASQDDDNEDLEDTDYRSVGYIHLRDARFFYGGNAIPGNQGVWWRGKLSEVVGFTYGLLAQE
ncbi:MAG TPA: hypothetical protein VM754_10530 [Actinomycetota bacterium]|nr:hypothetical protein [Actinomycetota bacterium]